MPFNIPDQDCYSAVLHICLAKVSTKYSRKTCVHICLNYHNAGFLSDKTKFCTSLYIMRIDIPHTLKAMATGHLVHVQQNCQEMTDGTTEHKKVPDGVHVANAFHEVEDGAQRVNHTSGSEKNKAANRKLLD